MGRYALGASVGVLMMGLLAIPNLSPAKDGDGKHRLLSAELRAKVEHYRDKDDDRREHRHHTSQGWVPGYLTALQTEVANLKTALAAANGQLSVLDGRLKAIETGGSGGGGTNPALTELAKYVTVAPGTINGLKGPHVVFHHANVHVQSGSGTTAEANGTTGLGNLVVGYNEMPVSQGWSRGGSHNLVVGPSHTFTSTAGVVFGNRNVISGQYATALGGVQNSSQGSASSILGGYGVIVNFPEATYP